jgi:hypothetical protein
MMVSPATLDGVTTISLSVASLGAISSPSATHCADGSAVTRGKRYSLLLVPTTVATWAATDRFCTGRTSSSWTSAGVSSAAALVVVLVMMGASQEVRAYARNEWCPPAATGRAGCPPGAP